MFRSFYDNEIARRSFETRHLRGKGLSNPCGFEAIRGRSRPVSNHRARIETRRSRVGWPRFIAGCVA